MSFKPPQQEIHYQFEPKGTDFGYQAQYRANYQNLFWALENLPNGPEKSVAMRKLLESMDATLRCVQK